jgi:hypothetical protein
MGSSCSQQQGHIATPPSLETSTSTTQATRGDTAALHTIPSGARTSTPARRRGVQSQDAGAAHPATLGLGSSTLPMEHQERPEDLALFVGTGDKDAVRNPLSSPIFQANDADDVASVHPPPATTGGIQRGFSLHAIMQESAFREREERRLRHEQIGDAAFVGHSNKHTSDLDLSFE